MKLGIIVDSSCGLTKKQANERGWGFLPLVMNINGKDIYDGDGNDAKDFYAKIHIDDEVRTSATPPALIIEEFEKFSQKNDLVIAYGISSELSSQTNNMKSFANDFKNVHVVNSKGVSHMIVKDLEEIEKLVAENMPKDKIIAVIEDLTKRQFGIAIPETLKWMVKGGRVGPSVAGMANLFRIVPIIKFEDGRLEKHGIGRVFKKSVINSTIEVLGRSSFEIIILHGENKNIDEFKKAIEQEAKKPVIVKYMPPVVALHTGPGVIAIMTRQKKK